MTTVVHVNRAPHDIYVGRAVAGRFKASKWANPFRIGRDGSREEVLQKFAAYLDSRPDLLAALGELKDKRLGCWCAPLPCHGDVLARLADK